MRASDNGFMAVFSSDSKTSGTTHDFTIRFDPAMDLSRSDRYAIALADLSCWYTWFNISNDYNNRDFKYSVNGGINWKTITLTPGIYNADALIAAISILIAANSDLPANLVISTNVNTQKFIFTLANNYQVDFTNMPIRTIFGAASAVYSVSGTMPEVAKMTNGVNTWLLHSDLLDYGINGPYQGRVLHSFSPQVSPGSHIREIPNQYYVMVRPNTSIQDVRFWVTDQNNTPINLNGEPVCIRLHFRPLKKNK